MEQDTGIEGAVLAVENSTGEIKAMVGGRDFAESKFNRAIQAQRQVGSSIKPFVYTAAVDQGADPDDIILDAPTTFNSGGVAYSPRNFDHKFEGNITLRRAFAQSRNIPAVKLGQSGGKPTLVGYLAGLGLSSAVAAVPAGGLGAGCPT